MYVCIPEASTADLPNQDCPRPLTDISGFLIRKMAVRRITGGTEKGGSSKGGL